jgi:hypothetical protein
VIDDDAASRAFLKVFAEGPSVAHVDASNALFAVVYGKQDRTPVIKKKNKTSSSEVLPLFNDPIPSHTNS